MADGFDRIRFVLDMMDSNFVYKDRLAADDVLGWTFSEMFKGYASKCCKALNMSLCCRFTMSVTNGSFRYSAHLTLKHRKRLMTMTARSQSLVSLKCESDL